MAGGALSSGTGWPHTHCPGGRLELAFSESCARGECLGDLGRTSPPRHTVGAQEMKGSTGEHGGGCADPPSSHWEDPAGRGPAGPRRQQHPWWQ